MRYHNGAFWAWAFKSAVMMLCWAALAVYFGKWWIALFAGLFMSSIKETSDGEEGGDDGEE